MAAQGRPEAAAHSDPLSAFAAGDTNACFAHMAKGGLCLATRGEFNRRAAGLIPDSLPAAAADREGLAASIRSSVIASLTESEFLSSQASKTSMYRNLEADAKQERAGREAETAASSEDSTLRRLYSEHSGALFRLQPAARLEFFAATDSILLDSVWTACRDGKRDPRWVPNSLSLETLPADLREHAQTLVPGRWHPPFRVSFGFVLVRLQKRGGRAVPAFAEVAPLLSVLLRTHTQPDSGYAPRARYPLKLQCERFLLDPA